MPTWVSPYQITGVGGQLFTDGLFKPELVLLGPGVTAGYVFSPGYFPDWFGTHNTVSLTGAGWWGSWSSHRRFDLPGTGASLLGINGATTFGDGFAVVGFFHRLQVEHREAELILRFTTDFRLSPSLTLSPMVGVFGGVSRTRYKYNAHLILPANRTSRPYHLYQLINGHTIGGLTGFRLNWRITRRLTLHTATHVGAYRARATLFATDCFENNPTAVCQLPASFTNTVRTSNRQTGFRTGVTTFLTLRLRRSYIQIGGFVSYLSAMPSVLNQTVTNTTTGTGTPVRLVFRHAWTTGGMVMWRFPFGARR